MLPYKHKERYTVNYTIIYITICILNNLKSQSLQVLLINIVGLKIIVKLLVLALHLTVSL